MSELKTFKEQVDELIEKSISNTGTFFIGNLAEIQTLIQAGEYFLEFIDKHVYHDSEHCYFDHHGYCQNHHTCGEDKCSNTIITKQKREIEESLIKLKEKIK